MKPTARNKNALAVLIGSLLTPFAHATVTANDDTATTSENTSVVIDVLSNDTTNVESDIFIEQFDARTPAYGSVVLNENNTLTYTPNVGFTGQDTFTYLAQDNSGYGGRATVTVNVEAGTVTPEPTPREDELETRVLGTNYKAMAPLIDRVCAAAGEEALPAGCDELFAALQSESATLQQLIEEITPDEYLSHRHVLSETSRKRMDRVYQSFAAVRARPAGASVSQTQGGLQVGGVAGDALGSKWALLGSIFSDDSGYSGSLLQAGYDTNGAGALVGANYRLTTSSDLGLALDFSQLDIDYADGMSSSDADSLALSGFYHYSGQKFALQAQLNFSQTTLSTSRSLSIIEPVLESDQDASSRDASVRLEWLVHQSQWTFTPFLRLDYQHMDIDAFVEHSDSPWAMAGAQQTLEQTNSSFGADLGYTMNATWGVFMPRFSVSGIQKSDLDDALQIYLANADANAPIAQFVADDEDSLFMQLEASGVWVLPGGLSFFAAVNHITSHDQLDGTQLHAGLNWEL